MNKGGRLRGNAKRSVSGGRKVYFAGIGEVEAELHDFENMASDIKYKGPAVIESPFTTIVADEKTSFQRTSNGSLLLQP